MTVRIALAQRAATDNHDLNLRGALRTMEEAAQRGAQFFCVPELALTPFFPQYARHSHAQAYAEPIPGPTTDRVAARARELGLVTVFNLYEQAGDRYFDSSPVIDADGTILGVTRMVHITDYACFHERAYYAEGDRGAPVYDTAVGRVGVAICYDRHYPEYMRALGVGRAELVVIPQAGTPDEWPDGMYEAEVRTAAFQNGYFAALCNRVGHEERLTFAGESFVVSPTGEVLARGKRLDEDLVIVDLDLSACAASPARTLFWNDRRPELYGDWLHPRS
ncbi:MAG: carbon-nitrogen hydrolase family protein [Gemmatimonadota bacterium]|nr:carbon-nitrogen hydrolase family protein [Gemmatimonadota bacterium]MDH3366259.1 carbon-nitrogen hydrolase family protein [Gemmatimonadota bacterium]MDH3476782.1 carbon-nitrogen hydrolase family protein [Gemmatimonadota bacterium]MDH3569051.1 carbon-nitrogen hydrolase family protein [Gemmatimonadota bacterium]MDH5550125.1 carbon-nitrogen hydrolase family protein [Gemmatimonadota bacterium]